MKLKLFFKNIRRAWFVFRIEREINNKIFPHLENEADHGYPFSSVEEFEHQLSEQTRQVQSFMQTFEKQAAKMPKAYGEAFRYIMYRDLKPRLEMYERLLARRIQPETCDPRFVARHA